MFDVLVAQVSGPRKVWRIGFKILDLEVWPRFPLLFLRLGLEELLQLRIVQKLKFDGLVEQLLLIL